MHLICLKSKEGHKKLSEVLKKYDINYHAFCTETATARAIIEDNDTIKKILDDHDPTLDGIFIPLKFDHLSRSKTYDVTELYERGRKLQKLIFFNYIPALRKVLAKNQQYKNVSLKMAVDSKGIHFTMPEEAYHKFLRAIS